MIELLPEKGTFEPGEAVRVEARGLTGSALVSLWRLAERVAERRVDPQAPVADFGPLAVGGYGVDSDDGARTALDVLANPMERFRYGFVSDYSAGRDPAAVADNVRRLHLNAIQFYDWMYRHAELLPPQDEFEDTLGQPVSLATVRALADAVRAAGASPLGYAAVYAVGEEHWDTWRDEGLFHADGMPWMLADFLWNVDPSSPRWLEHFATQLRAATEQVGFAGFHLDQFGAPKQAVRADGATIELAEAFPILIEHIRAALPEARLVFNNVNDFPTWTTAVTPQDAVYIEVWSPHDGLDQLGGLIAKARALAPDKPVSLAAYLSIYAQDDPSALAAMQLELAVVFSHGGTCLLHGEEDAILVDPYYVRHEHLDDDGKRVAKTYYDFAVRYGDLLFDRSAVDVTRTHSGGVNKEVRVTSSHARVSTECTPGAIWARVTSAPGRQLVSLIDLTGQTELAWDAPKEPLVPLSRTEVAFASVENEGPRFFFASPAESPSAQLLRSRREDGYDIVEVPSFTTWAIIWAMPERS